jgi:hypothetical protein
MVSLFICGLSKSKPLFEFGFVGSYSYAYTLKFVLQGGYVDLCRGVWRIQGSLAVSRSIGDRHLKQWVTAEPETKVIRIEPEHDLLILASDGLWDKVNSCNVKHDFRCETKHFSFETIE